uniref:Uncharacterized protein n=1 Tax=viral metagenome TaxID=1070528 RepID=A0A6C0KDW1_9ZZZZ
MVHFSLNSEEIESRDVQRAFEGDNRETKLYLLTLVATFISVVAVGLMVRALVPITAPVALYASLLFGVAIGASFLHARFFGKRYPLQENNLRGLVLRARASTNPATLLTPTTTIGVESSKYLASIKDNLEVSILPERAHAFPTTGDLPSVPSVDFGVDCESEDCMDMGRKWLDLVNGRSPPDTNFAVQVQAPETFPSFAAVAVVKSPTELNNKMNELRQRYTSETYVLVLFAESISEAKYGALTFHSYRPIGDGDV